MKPVDYRNENFAQLCARGLVSDRLEVYRAFLRHGPGTTREIAYAAGIDLLSLRPRATELYQLGFLETIEDASDKARTREGIYYALTEEQAARRFETRQREARTQQMRLQL